MQESPNKKFAPGNDYSITMIVKNEGNSPMTVLLEADVDASGWGVSIGGLSGSPLIEIDQFDQATFTVEISVPTSANNGEEVPISITATPLDTEQSFADSVKAQFTLIAIVEIASISKIVVNEIVHPRPITMVLFAVSVLLLFAGIQSRLNRRRWAAQMRLIESLSESEEEMQSTEPEIPAPVVVEEQPRQVDRYDEDDVELI